MKKIIIITLIALAVVSFGVILFIQDVKTSKLVVKEDNKNIQEVGQSFPEQKREHIAIGQQHEAYNSNPPTSGPHYADPADWGVYSEALPDEKALHNLEHGGIWISYKDIDDQTKSNLERIAKANSGSVIMTPRPTDDAKIVLASWTRIEKLDDYNESKILEFIKANKNKSPEPLAK